MIPTFLAKEKNTIHRYLELANASVNLQNCIKTIYDNAFTKEEIDLLKHGNNDEQLIANSPVTNMTTYFCDLRIFDYLLDMYKDFEFDVNTTDEVSITPIPALSNNKMQQLVENLNGQTNEDNKNNRALQLIGNSWLDAISIFLLNKRFPEANSSSLENIKSSLLIDSNIIKWFNLLDFKNFQVTTLEKHSDIERGSIQIFKAYIGALVTEYTFSQLTLIFNWINSLYEPELSHLEKNDIRGLYFYDLKKQVVKFFEHNKANELLTFEIIEENNRYNAEIKLGDISLAKAEGSTLKEAESNVSLHVLSDLAILNNYSTYENSVPFIPQKDIEKPAVKNALVVNEHTDVDVSATEITSEIMEKVNTRVTKMFSELTTNLLKDNNRTIGTKIASAIQEHGIFSDDGDNDRETEKGRGCSELTKINDSILLPSKNLENDIRLKECPIWRNESASTTEIILDAPTELPLLKDCDKTSKAKLYESFGRQGLMPAYKTVQLDMNDFYSVCFIKNKPENLLGQGRGSNKKIAEQTAAAHVLKSDYFKLIENETVNAMNGTVGVDILAKDDETEERNLKEKQVDYYKHFQSNEIQRDDVIYNTSDKMSMAELYSLLGSYHLTPVYNVKQIALNHFYAVCTIDKTAVILGEGHGTSKRIAQQIAAKQALGNQRLSEFLK